MCNCFKGGACELTETTRGSIDLDLNSKTIEMYDYYAKKTYVFLEIKYCPICGQELI